MRDLSEQVDTDTAVRLGCIEMRRFFKDMPQVALDKKSNFEYLEKEVGLKRFLPKTIIDGMKVRDSQSSTPPPPFSNAVKKKKLKNSSFHLLAFHKFLKCTFLPFWLHSNNSFYVYCVSVLHFDLCKISPCLFASEFEFEESDHTLKTGERIKVHLNFYQIFTSLCGVEWDV